MTQEQYETIRAALKSTPPEQFDYREAGWNETRQCGCASPVIRRAIGLAPGVEDEWTGPRTDISGVEDVFSPSEWTYLIGFHVGGLDARSVDFWYMSERAAAGERGIREAVRRLDVVARRCGLKVRRGPEASR